MRLRRVPTVVGLSATAAGTALGVLAVLFYGLLVATRPPPSGGVDAGGFAGDLVFIGAALCLLSGGLFAALYHNVVGEYGLPDSVAETALQRDEAAVAVLLTGALVGYFAFQVV